ncbi:MAG: arylsulfatase [Bacteroidales bacterium]|nr:arylsulfatase [Bacteroidales bacterium]
MKPLCIAVTLPLLGVAGLPHNQLNASQALRKPNIILIMADDMGYSDIGCFGSEIKTPNLDRLAEKGVRITQFYNASRCCPTRASLLTGLYQHQTGVGDMVNDLGYPSYQGYLNSECVTLAEAMKLNGYNTYMSGKWHVGGKPEVHPLKRGFDRYFGLIDGAGSYYKPIAYRQNMAPVRWMLDNKDFYPPDTGFYFTDAIAGYAISFLKEEKENGKPFFLYLPFTAPHWPLHALPEDIEKYRGKYMKGWDAIRKDRYQRMIKMGILDSSVNLSPKDAASPEWESLSQEEKVAWDLRMAVYAAMIDRMDQNIGRIVNYLTQENQIENTLIVFLADNGGCHENTRTQKSFLKANGETGTEDSFDAIEIPWANVSNTPFRMFKHWVHEGGIASPFIACLPGTVSEGKIVAQTGHIIDIMPTFIELAGGKYPESFNGIKIQSMEGVSLMPLLKGKKLNRSNPLFWEHEGNRAIRDGDWKLVSAYDNSAKKFKQWELYNLAKDRTELNDLSISESERTRKMIGEYEKWANRVGVIPRETIDRKK